MDSFLTTQTELGCRFVLGMEDGFLLQDVIETKGLTCCGIN